MRHNLRCVIHRRGLVSSPDGLGAPPPTDPISLPLFSILCVLCAAAPLRCFSYVLRLPPLLSRSLSPFLPFPFSRFLTPSPLVFLVFSFARFEYFFVSFFYIPTFCWLGSYYFLLRGRKHRFSGTNLLVFYLLALSLPTKCRIISHHF